ncbi:MAG TPA: alpha/beta fold hydrolase [Candidatus Dormibacteraeota bacterium]|nr:alpha/beta fold hydrolase [Candidatus Dormibacteraeota bacterium]
MNRSEVVFESSGVRCAGWLYRPEGAEPHPAIVLGQGLGGIRAQRLDAFAERFAAAGIAALAFDYRYFGDSEGEPRQLLDRKLQQQDYVAAIDFVRDLPDVDPARVAVWGWSYSGGHALTVAARDHRVAACVVQAPQVDGVASMLLIPKLVLLQLVIAGLRDQLGALLGRPPYTIPTVAPRGSVGALTADEAVPGYRAQTPAGVVWVQRVAARAALTTPMFTPKRSAHRITCPVLVCIPDNDMTVPPAEAQKTADRIADVEVRHYPYGHYEINVGEGFEAVVADQVDFLRRRLLRNAGAKTSAARVPSG